MPNVGVKGFDWATANLLCHTWTAVFLQVLQTFAAFANFFWLCKLLQLLQSRGFALSMAQKNGVDLGGSWSTPFSEEGSA